MKKCVLVITDGVGINPNSAHNAFAAAKKPSFDWLYQNAAVGRLQTSGEAVGLPKGQMGNSEVGHMTIGSGRIIYQNLVKIDCAIESGELGANPTLLSLFTRCKRIHIIGLYSDGGVHSHLNHFEAVAQLAKKSGCEVFAHAITDGRDVLPTSAAGFLERLEEVAKNEEFKIASVSGRFYSMDRDKRWERVKRGYESIALNENLQQLSPTQYIISRYEEGEFDEFIEPASFCDFGGILSEDGVVFVNFRNDRAREICAALGDENFSEFERKSVCKNVVTMTKYDDKFKFGIVFEPEEIDNTLSEVISAAGLRQFHTAETEKYAHVTFFFNGGKEALVKGETRLLVPSPKVATYDLQPQMSASGVTDAVLKAMEAGYDFVVVNYANGDMVGHTGNFDAAVLAIEAIDEAIGRILTAAQDFEYSYIQISDHGNCEEMEDASGQTLTNHTTYDVPVFVVSQGVSSLKEGGLANVAASVLELMGLEVPMQMQPSLFYH